MIITFLFPFFKPFLLYHTFCVTIAENGTQLSEKQMDGPGCFDAYDRYRTDVPEPRALSGFDQDKYVNNLPNIVRSIESIRDEYETVRKGTFLLFAEDNIKDYEKYITSEPQKRIETRTICNRYNTHDSRTNGSNRMCEHRIATGTRSQKVPIPFTDIVLVARYPYVYTEIFPLKKDWRGRWVRYRNEVKIRNTQFRATYKLVHNSDPSQNKEDWLTFDKISQRTANTKHFTEIKEFGSFYFLDDLPNYTFYQTELKNYSSNAPLHSEGTSNGIIWDPDNQVERWVELECSFY